MRFHWQNLNDNNKYWLHGRAWLHFCGLTFNPEWAIFKRSFKCQVSGAYSEPGITISISPFLASFYLTVSWQKYGPVARFMNWRQFGFSFHDRALWIHLFCRTDCYKGSDPFWKKPIAIHFDDLLLGRSRFSERTLSTQDVVIPMPEGSYPATVELKEFKYKRPRWFARYVRTAKVDIDGGIPFPGKGENSWDCGMDGTYGLSCPAETPEEAIAKAIESVLRSRRRYAGNVMWMPKAENQNKNSNN